MRNKQEFGEKKKLNQQITTVLRTVWNVMKLV